MLAFTLPELLDDNVKLRPDKVALVRGEEELTFAELTEQSRDLARRLATLKVSMREPICLHVPKSTFEVIATFAISRLGAIVTNVNPQLTERQLRHVLDNTGARILVTTPRVARELVANGVPPTLEHVVTETTTDSSRPFVGIDELEPDGNLAWPRIVGADPCSILYTSGSTGLPKGVLLTHETVVQSARSAARHLENKESDRALGGLPLSFDYGLSQLTSMNLVGGTLVLPKASIPAELMRTVDEHDVNAIAAVPTTWIQFVRFLKKEGRVLERVRYVANSGGFLPTDIINAWPEVFPNARHYLMYGMTEGFRSSYLHPDEFQRKTGSIGKPLPDVDLFVVHPESGICGPGEHGEILHRSGSLMSSGYYRDSEATAERIRPCSHLEHLIGNEKVLYTGDTGYYDKEGFLWFVARTTTFIKCSDFRVSPTEVEDVVFSSGLVTDVVAFGTAHESLGQVVNIAVAHADEVDTAAVMQHCRASMPPYMRPAAVHVWDEPVMPRTSSGKIDRMTVIAKFTAE